MLYIYLQYRISADIAIQETVLIIKRFDQLIVCTLSKDAYCVLQLIS